MFLPLGTNNSHTQERGDTHFYTQGGGINVFTQGGAGAYLHVRGGANISTLEGGTNISHTTEGEETNIFTQGWEHIYTRTNIFIQGQTFLHKNNVFKQGQTICSSQGDKSFLHTAGGRSNIFMLRGRGANISTLNIFTHKGGGHKQFQTRKRTIIFTPYLEGGQTFILKGRGGQTLYVGVGGG